MESENFNDEQKWRENKCMENEKIYQIIQLLKQQKNLDFSGFRIPMLTRRIQHRMVATQTKNLSNYLNYLNENPDESVLLIDALTINVSSFFRNPLLFDYLQKFLFPKIIHEKQKTGNELRIWSAGCAFGEEPFSIALLLAELFKKEFSEKRVNVQLFATDIDEKALAKAKEGVYSFSRLEDTRLSFIENYFTKIGDEYFLHRDIIEMVQFSFHDLLSSSGFAPPQSIYGELDVVFCRNVLIYFEPQYQQIILNKLLKAIKTNGYLVLGEAEIPIGEYKFKLHRVCDICRIYKKIGT